MLANDAGVLSKHESREFERYCTVFETIVLGRYINQIQECEGDLDSLVSQSRLEPRWLYTLLASALDGRMQDSNKKFIGNWIMRSVLTPSEELNRFFSETFFLDQFRTEVVFGRSPCSTFAICQAHLDLQDVIILMSPGGFDSVLFEFSHECRH